MSEETYKPWAQHKNLSIRGLLLSCTHTSFVRFGPNNGQTGLEPKFICCFQWFYSQSRIWLGLLVKLVYDRYHYFVLGPIPKLKPKLVNTFGRYRNRYQNHISKGESSYQVNLALVWGNFSIIKRPIKPNLLPNFKHF